MAYHIEATQTQPVTGDPVDAPGGGEPKGIMEQYATMITSHKALLQSYSSVVVVDGYFMKKGFIEALTTEGFEVVTKGRRDAALKYLYNGKQRGIGRPRQFSGKVDLHNMTIGYGSSVIRRRILLLTKQ